MTGVQTCALPIWSVPAMRQSAALGGAGGKGPEAKTESRKLKTEIARNGVRSSERGKDLGPRTRDHKGVSPGYSSIGSPRGVVRQGDGRAGVSPYFYTERGARGTGRNGESANGLRTDFLAFSGAPFNRRTGLPARTGQATALGLLPVFPARPIRLRGGHAGHLRCRTGWLPTFGSKLVRDPQPTGIAALPAPSSAWSAAWAAR